MKRLALLLPFLLALGGCVTTGGGSVAGGECKVFEAPKYAVRGATQYDQDWIDPTIEGGVGACKWARPAARTAELDAPKAAPAPKAITKKKKKGSWLWRLKWPHKAVAPVISTPEAPVPVTPIADSLPPPPAPPAPRSVIDELLNPTDAK